MNIIEINELSKSFGEVKAVNNLSFHVKKGELFAFLGENGAGKSTTISIICGLLKKDGGSVFVDGVDLDKDVEKVKNNIGVVFQNCALDKVLTVKDNLKSRAALYGICGKEFEQRLEKLAHALEFFDLLNRPVGKLSGGQRRRIDIARALLHEPKILILDEPTTGLDPQTRKIVWNLIAKFRKEKLLTVFLTTHYMEEAAEADYVVIIDSGKIAAEGTPYVLKTAYTGDFIDIFNVEENAVKTMNKPYRKINGGYRISVKDTAEATSLILKYSELFLDYEIMKGKMDDVFLAVTGKKLEGEGERL